MLSAKIKPNCILRGPLFPERVRASRQVPDADSFFRGPAIFESLDSRLGEDLVTKIFRRIKTCEKGAGIEAFSHVSFIPNENSRLPDCPSQVFGS